VSRAASYDRCTLWHCDMPHYSRGLCARHYQSWRRTGSPISNRTEDLQRILDTVEQARELLIELSDDYVISVENHNIGSGIYSGMCRYCLTGGVWPSSSEPNIVHKDFCPVKRARDLIKMTEQDHGEY
jgi:hypothetical protein